MPVGISKLFLFWKDKSSIDLGPIKDLTYILVRVGGMRRLYTKIARKIAYTIFYFLSSGIFQL